MRKKVIVGLFLFLVLIGVYWLLSGSDVLNLMMDGDALQAWVVQLGLWGPLAIVALMILAVVWSPIPSAPVALAAGAAYGHTWGALYVLLGAELGAMIAFALARWLGQDVIKRWFGKRLSPGWTGSQNILMLLVFITRLLPFVSFDIMSYAAGLTALTGWRFAVATLAGIVPASFLLAHFGSEMASGNVQRVVTTVLLVLGFASLPFLIGFVRHQSHRGVPEE